MHQTSSGFIITLTKNRVVFVIVEIGGVTVNPLCPTNKIAPHRRNGRGQRDARTIGAFYNLLVPDSSSGYPSQLQEEPENESTDCGVIEDYDENDLSSLTKPSRRNDRTRFFTNFFQQYLRPTTQRITTTTNRRPTRPPSGGYFGSNAFRPQPEHQPSDQIKPVHEGFGEAAITYRPTNVVGALSGNVIGAVQVKPTRRNPDLVAQKQHPYPNYVYPPQHRDRPRTYGRDGIISSFIDLIL
ncbi:uncharacterized protein LOC121740462 [Aricia agestis]|uniref:uncharacterized protein LOC121740462 n=1 Tax=Aricia agestis TaxID=91739 RepID=UPI001C206663|nr:uncharacterized protein LOC121740462 [Aricia agestis]